MTNDESDEWRSFMVRWMLCGCACALLVLGAAGEVVAEEQSASADARVRDAVKKVLHAQQEAWDGGDVRAFMEHYWKSDDLTFSSGGKTTRGWQATLDGYLQ